RAVGLEPEPGQDRNAEQDGERQHGHDPQAYRDGQIFHVVPENEWNVRSRRHPAARRTGQKRQCATMCRLRTTRAQLCAMSYGPETGTLRPAEPDGRLYTKPD